MGGEAPAISHIITVRATISYSTSSEGHNEQESTLNQLLVEMDGTFHLMERVCSVSETSPFNLPRYQPTGGCGHVGLDQSG